MTNLDTLISQDYSSITENVIKEISVPDHVRKIEKNSVRIENRFFYPALGADGYPNLSNFIDVLTGSIVRFTLSARELEERKKHILNGDDVQAELITNTGRNRLVRYAKGGAKNAGEIGELNLFILLEAVFNAPKIASKMKLKTNVNMHVHGSDAVHAFMGSGGVLTLILGESKFRNKRSTALSDAVDSIDGFLASYMQVGKEIELVEANLDSEILDDELKKEILKYFGKFTPESNKVSKTVAVLLGYDRISLYKNLDQIDDPSKREEELEDRYRKHAETAANEFHAALSGLNNPEVKKVGFYYCIFPFEDLNTVKEQFYEYAGLNK